VSCGGFADHVKITFLHGPKLTPVPPVGTGKQHGASTSSAPPISTNGN